MQWLYDHEGRRYLDLLGGILTVSVGHCHRKIVAAVEEQLKTLWHTTTLYRHSKQFEFIEKLTSKLPEKLQVVYLTNSGTEANDLAIVLAKCYTGHNDIISLQNSYHGNSSSMMALTAMQSFRQPIPVPPGFHHAMVPDPFRNEWGGCRDCISQVPDSCSCTGDCLSTDKYIDQLKEVLEFSIPSRRVAAFFAESIQGAGGIVQFPKGYIKRAQQLIKEHGGIFVADEVQTGFARTGDTFWGFESHGIIPDIVTLAKGIANGLPFAAVVTTKEIAEAHTKANYFNTFSGNALAAAAGVAVLEVIDDENIQDHCKKIGEYFIRQLIQLQQQFPIIGDVRGKGLMLAMELVRPGTKENLSDNCMIRMHQRLKDLGVLTGLGGRNLNVLKITPPMCITKEDVDFAVSVFNDVFKQFS
ncbi:alanine--glyoxylate aminotransferase 2, mitochondrial [Bombyx mori]|uniref:Alanine--glyoxylate aminotransferase 2, mitochondrial n=1 Tax=Bombyx mori TaxID=7091 RepID=A0A8R2LZK3_BOMMO|nr:alanine--glyoxylate aminotransferase 2, mitochondrial-like [Bombyx mori]